MGVSVTARGRLAVLKTSSLSSEYLKTVRQFPNSGKFYWEGKNFVFEPTAQALDFLQAAFPDAKWDESACKFQKVVQNIRSAAPPPTKVSIKDFVYKTKPFKHQEEVFYSSRDKHYFALLMEQGTGKTKVILDNAAYLYATGQIRGLLVIAKNGVHRNWTDKEIPEHLPDWCPYVKAAWKSQRGEKSVKSVLTYSDKPRLAIMSINVEALSTKKGEQICEKFLLSYPSMVVVDESTCIKTPSAKRTKAVTRLGNFARFRRILTGTPITKGPLDAYSQFGFLDESILGFGSYYAFKAHYAVQKDLPGKMYRGRPVQVVVGYRNIDELQQKIAKHSFRVLKKDCLDLPEKLYTTRFFDMTSEQERLYSELVEEIVTEFNGRRISAPLAITRMLRLHQITCGFVPTEEKGVYESIFGDGENPRIKLLMDILEETTGKAIIYANFTQSLNDIYKAIVNVYGRESIVTYSGKVKDQDKRVQAISAFQDPDSEVRWFLAQTEAAAYGLTLTQAQTVLYYSNDYKLETRLQSEDRAHRIGQRNNVLYIDVAAEGTVDESVIDNLKGKFDIASKITGDKLVSWLTKSKE